MALTLLVASALGAVMYAGLLRPWMNRWGATRADLARAMAGDGLVVEPTFSYTMAITINARPEHVWPWLVQMGYQRGGLYSYDWLDRLFGFLDRPSATRILPELQHLAVGDEIPLPRGLGWPVVTLEPSRALVLDMRTMAVFEWVWQFGLYPVDEQRTQFVSRSHLRARSVWSRLFNVCVMEPAAFLMTRRMLLGIKQRAERLATERRALPVRVA